MDTPNGFVYIDPTKLSIPVKTAIANKLKEALVLFKQQQEQLYNFSVSPDFKEIFNTNPEEIKRFDETVIVRIQDKLNTIIENFKILGMNGGGLFDFIRNNKKQPDLETTMEMLLNDLEESVNGEKIKFNGLFNNIKLYIFNIKTDKQKMPLILDAINTKMATFDVIINEIISIIKKYQKIAPNGGRKLKTHRKKQLKKRKSIKRSAHAKRRL